ncbi:hypothetical protein [Nocardioides baculatus]|uniref:Uncharacterized protein n=1 Tax=Nocardioides baculatus TaxID=2801337 RepID=A0ABS1LAL8_9ACTN|nr:hypothetical protein [Nocardioides baculatus]MBL0747561.1 hypothetical protein [Nocardioides baculatus]
MKTTIHHVATCDACSRTTVHRSVVEHGPGRAVSSHHACEPCGSRVAASAVVAPVLSMITARSVRGRVDASLVPVGEGHLGAIAN